MKHLVEKKHLPIARYYALQLNLIIGIYNVGVLFLYYQNWIAFIIGMLNIGVYLSFKDTIKKII